MYKRGEDFYVELQQVALTAAGLPAICRMHASHIAILQELKLDCVFTLAKMTFFWVAPGLLLADGGVRGAFSPQGSGWTGPVETYDKHEARTTIFPHPSWGGVRKRLMVALHFLQCASIPESPDAISVDARSTLISLERVSILSRSDYRSRLSSQGQQPDCLLFVAVTSFDSHQQSVPLQIAKNV